MDESFLLLSDLPLLVRDDFNESAKEFIIQVVSSHELFGSNRRVRVKVSMQSHSLSTNIHIHFKLLNLIRWAHRHPGWCYLLVGIVGNSSRRWWVRTRGFHVSASNIAPSIWMESVFITFLQEVNIVFWEVVFVRLCFSHWISVQKLPFVFKETLLFSMPGSQKSFRLSLIFIGLEGRCTLDFFFVLSQSLLLPVKILSLLKS